MGLLEVKNGVWGKKSGLWAQKRGGRGNGVEIKRKRISTPFPLRNTSKFSFEVLCLGLEGTNPRISDLALVAIKQNLLIDPLLFGCGILGFKRWSYYKTGHT